MGNTPELGEFMDSRSWHDRSIRPSHISAPLRCMVTEIAVSPGTEVKAGDKLVTIEAMKMLTTVSAPVDGIIKDILVKKGVQVDSDDLLVILE